MHKTILCSVNMHEMYKMPLVLNHKENKRNEKRRKWSYTKLFFVLFHVSHVTVLFCIIFSNRILLSSD